jgi:acetyl-CoA synthetase
MSEVKVHDIPAAFAANAHVKEAQYRDMYKRSVEDPDGFWAEQAEKYVTWISKWNKVLDWSFKGDVHIRWFEGAKLNVSYNCLDRHLDSRGDQPAIIWEGDDPNEDRTITYRQLHEEVCRFANVLKSRGVKKGDRVSIYMPMIPEAAVAMLACTRIGAVHSVVFGGFSPDALRDRIQDSDCQVVITADQSLRGGKKVPLKKNADRAISQCPNVHTCIVVRRGGEDVEWKDGRDVWYHEALKEASADCPPEEMDAEDPLFILYTSGSTGKPKGVLHSTGGYLS